MSAKLDWERDGKDWPNRDCSRFVKAGGLRWHVQVIGEGEDALLLHGTGAASHSFADLIPKLSKRFRVIVPDLPGHGFTEAPTYKNHSLPAMAEALGKLMEALDADPVLAIGHSAGAAISMRMSLDQIIKPKLLVSLNGAILPLHGIQGQFFAPLAKLFIRSGFMSRVFAWRARHTDLVNRLMSQTGSNIPETTLRHYARLAKSPDHIDAAIGMMANWDLGSMESDLARLKPDILLIVGSDDRMISPSQGLRLRRMLQDASLEILPNLGHLAHEEAPDQISTLILNRFDAP